MAARGRRVLLNATPSRELKCRLIVALDMSAPGCDQSPGREHSAHCNNTSVETVFAFAFVEHVLQCAMSRASVVSQESVD